MSVPRILLFLVICLCAATQSVGDVADLLPPGFRPRTPGTHALVNARIVPQPGKVIETGTILVRDGLIEAVGADIKIPADARRWDLKGSTVYAGFIEPYWIRKTRAPLDTTGIQPIRAGSVVNFYGAENHAKTKLPEGPGYRIHGMTPEYRVLEKLRPEEKKFAALREQGFTAANIVPDSGILRGRSSLVSLTDGPVNEIVLRADALQHIAFEPRADVYPASLMGVIAALRQTFYDAKHYRLDREHYLKNPLGRPRPPVDAGLEALQAVEAGQRVVIEPGSCLMVEQAAKLGKLFDFRFALVACGEEWRRPEIAKATKAPFIVPVNFSEVPKLPGEDDWIDVSLTQLRRWDWGPQNPAKLKELGLEVALTTYGLGEPKDFRKQLQRAMRRGLSEADALAALTTVPAELCGVADTLGVIAKGRIANLTIVTGDTYFEPENKVREVWIDGRRLEPEKPVEKPTDDASEKTAKPDAKKESLAGLQAKLTARHPSLDRGPLLSPSAVLIEGATVWTCGPDGVLTNAAVLADQGGVRAIGEAAVEMAKEFGDRIHRIDGTGKHVTPGLIDCHSHTAILGGVNESTLPSTAMVGIVDVINSETENLYQQLAGGLTTANLLHGSANPIGGRNAVIKLRFGAGPSGLHFRPAPKGIKFALGENVKQSNWGDERTTRFPQSRMGVPTFHANRFTAARQYQARWKRFQEQGGRPPRMNLELEVLGEIIDGERWIHCHSYRQDEIVAFLRTMESFGVQVGTLQHVLEGYKIADEIVKHGAGASAFSDWWAYKFEVYDANAYAGALMWQRGVLVSFNSDSSELARRMNLEAAKAVKYGGVPEIEALKFVTLNPARQLRIDRWVGSLEPGKHADFVIWSGHPLAASSSCLETWIDGKQYYALNRAPGRAKARQDERAQLIAKAKGMQEPGGDDDAPPKPAQQEFFRRLWETSSELGLDQCQDCLAKGGVR
jgi:imidazolonepropionase-like amidohydrolase